MKGVPTPTGSRLNADLGTNISSSLLITSVKVFKLTLPRLTDRVDIGG